jgi:uncharacterized membrane protein
MQTKQHIQIWFAGLFVVAPFALTLYVVWRLASWLGGLGFDLIKQALKLNGIKLLENSWINFLMALCGVVVVIMAVYFVGLLTHWWIFRKILSILENWIARVPGVKTIYESVRDLMKLFGGDSSKMGRAVLYNIPQTDINVLGILTNDHPSGMGDGSKKLVAVYLPFSYMFGGPTIYVSPDLVRDAGISVDQALKLCATAHVGPHTDDDGASSIKLQAKEEPFTNGTGK